MSKKQQMNNRLLTQNTFNSCFAQCQDMAKSVFYIHNLPKLIDFAYIADIKISRGGVAFFVDDELNELVALPFRCKGKKLFNGLPNDIECYGANGYKSDILHYGEYVIMWDNLSHRPILNDLYLYAQRLARIQRTIDINIIQQKTPRIFKVNSDNLESVRNAIDRIDEFEEVILSYENFNPLTDSVEIQPAPFVASDLKEIETHIHNQLLRFIGVSSLDVEKKERLLSSEVEAAQGGSSLFLNWRGLACQQAVDEINIKFSDYLSAPLVIEDFSDYIVKSIYETKDIAENIKEGATEYDNK